MTTFKEIQGRNIRSYTTNPDNPLEGQMWYNQTDLALKGVVAVGAWSSASPLITGRQGLAGGGTQTACAFWGGSGPTNSTEEYNGSGFSTGGNLPYSAVYLAGCGTQTAGLACGGDPGPTQVATACTYDGASWTGIPSLNTARSRIGATGTTSAALAFGGGNPWGVNNSEEYSGSSWAEGNNLNTARRVNNSGGGPQTAGIVAGGDAGPPSAPSVHTEEYDGSSWTTATNLGTATREMGSSGTQTAFLVSGGLAPSASTTCQQYDGTSWTTLPAALPSAINQHDQEGTTLAAISTGGTPNINATNEYNFAATVITPGAWASGGVLGTARDEGGAAANAVSDAALYFGGYNGSALGITEEYNGSSWSEQNDLGTARSGRLGGAGTQTAGLCFGGNPGGALNEEYDGTSWTERGDLNTPRSQLCGVGISTAALAYGGQTTPSGLNNTEEYDGSSWTAQNTLNTARYGFSGAGLQTSALAFCGVQSPPTISNDTEEYNGTSWTSVNDMIQPAFNHGGSGAQTAALLFGGQTGTSTGGAKTSAAFGYDGTNWSTRPSMGTTRSQISGSSGTSNISAAAFGGTIPPYSTATEEFTGETTAANVVDITTS